MQLNLTSNHKIGDKHGTTLSCWQKLRQDQEKEKNEYDTREPIETKIKAMTPKRHVSQMGGYISSLIVLKESTKIKLSESNILYLR